MRAESLIGKNTADVVSFICNRNPQIRSLMLNSYDALHDNGSFGKMLYLRDYFEVPRHNLLSPNWIDKIAKKGQDGNQSVAVCSQVTLVDNTVMHIPMFDFDSHGIDQRDVQGDVRDLKRELNNLRFPPGFILDSGGGLHYIGTRLIPEANFDSFIEEIYTNGSMLVDPNWLWFCQESCHFVLRANKPEIKIKVPEVISLFRPRYKVQLKV